MNQALVDHINQVNTVICNIKMMKEKIHGYPCSDLLLKGKTLETLREIQDTTIKEYNEAIKNDTCRG